MARWLPWLLVFLPLAGCADADPPPSEVTAWGSWDPSGSALTVNVRALDEPFSATRCDCDIEVFVDDHLLGTWHADPQDFQATSGKDRVWSVLIPASQVPHCDGGYDFALDLEARLTLADGTELTDSRMLACTP